MLQAALVDRLLVLRPLTRRRRRIEQWRHGALHPDAEIAEEPVAVAGRIHGGQLLQQPRELLQQRGCGWCRQLGR